MMQWQLMTTTEYNVQARLNTQQAQRTGQDYGHSEVLYTTKSTSSTHKHPQQTLMDTAVAACI